MKLKLNRVFLRYLASYLSILVALWIVLGLGVFLASVREIESAARLETQARQSAAQTYLAEQMEVVEDIVYRVKTTLCYRPYYFQSNAYYETNLLADFSQYRNFSPLVQDYYLYYTHTGSVYSPEAKYSYARLASLVLGLSDGGEALREEMDRVERFSVIRLGERPDLMLMAWRFNVVSALSESGDVRLIFLFDEDTLCRAVAAVAGVGPEMVSLSLGDTVFAGAGAPAGDWAASGSGFSARLAPEAYPRLGAFRVLVVGLMAGAILLAGVLAAMAASRMYRPIRAIGHRLSIPEGEGTLSAIEESISLLQENNRLSQTRLERLMAESQRQTGLLRRQLLYRLLHGDDVAQLARHFLPGAGISLPHPRFAVLLVSPEGGAALDDDQLGELVEGLSDEETKLYWAVPGDGASRAVILNMTSPGRLEACLGLVEDLLGEAGLPAQITAGSVQQGLSGVAESMQSALSRREKDRRGAGAWWRDGAEAEALALRIREGDAGESRAALDRLMRLIQENRPREPEVMYGEIARRLTDAAGQLGVAAALPPADGSAAFYEACQALTERLCEAGASLASRKGGENAQRILAYVDEHALEYQIGLGLVAEQFALSERQAGRVIKQYTGMTFREYLTRRRMDWARKQLTNTDTLVSEIATQAGYTSISHFIKAFRDDYGLTPGEYRRSRAV